MQVIAPVSRELHNCNGLPHAGSGNLHSIMISVCFVLFTLDRIPTFWQVEGDFNRQDI